MQVVLAAVFKFFACQHSFKHAGDFCGADLFLGLLEALCQENGLIEWVAADEAVASFNQRGVLADRLRRRVKEHLQRVITGLLVDVDAARETRRSRRIVKPVVAKPVIGL